MPTAIGTPAPRGNELGHELHPPGAGLRAGHDACSRTSCSACPSAPASAWWTGRRSSARGRGRSPSGSASVRRSAPSCKRLSTAENWLIYDLPRAGPQGAADRDGRADRVAVGGGGGAAVRDHPRSCGVGGGDLYVSHRLDEITGLCRPGDGVPRRAARWPSSPAPELTRRGLVEAIVGESWRGAVEIRTAPRPAARWCCSVRGLTRRAAGDRRQLRSASRRGARPRRAGRRRPQRARRG